MLGSWRGAVSDRVLLLQGVGLTPSIAVVMATNTIFALSWSMFLVIPQFHARVLGAPIGTIGTIVAVAGLASGLSAFRIGPMLDRRGGATLLRAGLWAQIIASLGYLGVRDVGWLLYASHGMTGVAFVLTFNAASVLIVEQTPPEHSSQMLGWLGATTVVMTALGPALAELLAEASWSWVFIASALLSGGGVLACVGLGESAASLAPVRQQQHKFPPLSHLNGIFAASFLLGSAFSAIFVFHQPYALSLGIPRVRAFFIAFTVTALAARLLVGRMNALLGSLRLSAAACLGYAATATAMTHLSPSLLAACGAVFGVAHGVVHPTLHALVMREAGPQGRGRATTSFNCLFNLGACCGGLAWGHVAERLGYSALFYGATLCSVLAGIAVALSNVFDGTTRELVRS